MPHTMLNAYDIIIIGSGIAGLSTALNVSDDKSILVLTKDEATNTNTNMAQGGIAVTFDPNSFESHVQDTLKTGNFYNDETRLRSMVEEGGAAINTLIDWGVNFDRDKDGNLLLTKEGGHSERRIIHYKDTTGKEIAKGLLNACMERNNIHLVENIFVKDVLKNDKGIYGVEIISNGFLSQIFASNVVIATGGIGEIYENTTNATISTGDGIAIAHRCGAEIKDMEFVQFHPTALNVPGDGHFLISEAVRGEGGILRNSNGEAFMSSYHELKDLAPRSIVSKAIFEESKKQGNNDIYLDVTHLGATYVKNRFPNIFNECSQRDIDITKELIPVVPVQHYIMGGIVTNDSGETNIPRLYACGEVSCTGVHGANRMASNSLLEAAVYAKRVADSINISTVDIDFSKLVKTKISNHEVCFDINETREKLKKIMAESVFIFRTNKALEQAYVKVTKLIEDLPDEIVCKNYYELMNMLLVSKLIIVSALNRKCSLGSHIVEGGEPC